MEVKINREIRNYTESMATPHKHQKSHYTIGAQ